MLNILQVLQFLSTLKQDLPNITCIESVLGQCTYFGISFGKVKADFMGHMSDIFLNEIKNRFEIIVLRITKTFEKNMHLFILTNKLQKFNLRIEPIINYVSLKITMKLILQ